MADRVAAELLRQHPQPLEHGVQRLLTQLMDGAEGNSDLDCDWRILMLQVRAHEPAAARRVEGASTKGRWVCSLACVETCRSTCPQPPTLSLHGLLPGLVFPCQASSHIAGYCERRCTRQRRACCYR